MKHEAPLTIWESVISCVGRPWLDSVRLVLTRLSGWTMGGGTGQEAGGGRRELHPWALDVLLFHLV